jgi:hypothetical protein
MTGESQLAWLFAADAFGIGGQRRISSLTAEDQTEINLLSPGHYQLG